MILARIVRPSLFPDVLEFCLWVWMNCEVRHINVDKPDEPVGRYNSVGIATDYGVDGPGIEFRWGRDFPHLSRPALGSTQPPVQGVPDLSPGGKEWPGRDADPSPSSSAVVKKEQSNTSTPLWVFRPVQSLSARTRVHFKQTNCCLTCRKLLHA